MTIAFIRQVEDALYQLDRLADRAAQDDSQFRWKIESARDYIKAVSDTYHEVLHRDSNEDETYIPPLKEVK